MCHKQNTKPVQNQYKTSTKSIQTLCLLVARRRLEEPALAPRAAELAARVAAKEAEREQLIRTLAKVRLLMLCLLLICARRCCLCGCSALRRSCS